MSAKKNILILCDWFLPGYLAGGPIQSIATLTQHLGNDFNFKIITTDRDFKSQEAYNNITPNSWTTYEGRTVFYVSPENMNPRFILDLIQHTEHDTIYLNSLFSKLFTVYPLKWKSQGKLTSTIILAPRGMLRDGALAVKPLKKQLFLLYAKYFKLFKNVHWQSTSQQETLEIKKRIGTHANISEISNLSGFASTIQRIEKKQGELKLCFIARMVDIKNLNFAIDVLKEIKDCSIIFDIYGPQEDLEYWQLCETNAKQLPKNVQFNYIKVLKPSEIGSTIANYHALFLPTKTENYGHIIVEALQHNRPVIISDQTPWRHLEQESVGFDIALTHTLKFVEALRQLSNINQSEFDVMCNNCKLYLNKKLNIEAIKQQYIQLFNQA